MYLFIYLFIYLYVYSFFKIENFTNAFIQMHNICHATLCTVPFLINLLNIKYKIQKELSKIESKT